MARGLRRGEPQNPPVGSTIGSTTVLAPVEVERGLPRGTSNDASERALGEYNDSAVMPRHQAEPPRQPAPFSLKK